MFIFLFIFKLFFLLPAVIAQIYNHTSEIVIPSGVPNQVNAKIERHSVIAQTKTG